MKFKKQFIYIFVVFILIFTVGCNKSNKENNDKEIHIGFNPGPYIDQFKIGIEPQLINQGYTITYANFNDGIQPNLAVANGEIDVNIFQHTTYMESINKEENIELIGVVQVPTPPLGLYSHKHKNLDIKENVIVAMPNDPVNMTRALKILEKIEWITLRKEIDPLRITEQDIADNPYEIEIRPIDAAQGPRALEDADYVAIQGNYAVSGDIELTSALAQESMEPAYVNVVTINKENEDEQFVKDIVEAYHSPKFKKSILENNDFDGYFMPEYFTE